MSIRILLFVLFILGTVFTAQGQQATTPGKQVVDPCIEQMMLKRKQQDELAAAARSSVKPVQLSATPGATNWSTVPALPGGVTKVTATPAAKRGNAINFTDPPVDPCDNPGGPGCTGPAVFNVTGGGQVCNPPYDLFPLVGLDGSQSGVTYTLYRDYTYVTTKSGTGGALYFSSWATSAGTYTIGATNSCSSVMMSGSAVVTLVTPPNAYTFSGGGEYCSGDTGLQMILSNSQVGVNYYLMVNGSFLSGSNKTGTGAFLKWTGLTTYGTYQVFADNSYCEPVAMTGTPSVTPRNPTILPVGGGGTYCTGGVTITLTGTTQTDAVYELLKNGVVVAGSQKTGTGSSLSWPGISIDGIYTIQGKRGTCAAVLMSGSATVIQTSPIIYNVSLVGSSLLCPGMMGTIQLSSSQYGVQYQLYKNGVADGSPVSGTGEAMTFTRSATGVYTVKATYTGCPAVDMTGSASLTVLSESAKKTDDFFTHAQLSIATPVAKKLYINRCDEVLGQCGRTLKKVKIYVKFDLGDVYKWGKYNGQPNYAGVSKFTLRGLNSSGTQLFTSGLITLNISKVSAAPEQLYYYEVTTPATLTDLREIEVLPATPASGGYSFTSALNTNDIRLKFSYQEEIELNVSSANVVLGTVNALPANPWEKEFTWSVSNGVRCQGINNYQVQVLKLNPGQSSGSLSEKDWKHSLNMETGTAATSLKLVLAEGSGNYAWRVRAIGSLEGSITNPLNWGVWTSIGTVSGYVQPEEDLNWIYSRTFTEGNEISESMVYANGLQQVSQRQSRLQSIGPASSNNSDQLVASQTVRDYVGRDALTTLPVPVGGVNAFGYRVGLLKNGSNAMYSAADFDENPYTASAATVEGNYYSGVGVTVDGKVFNDRVADAEGVPYSRTLFTKDGTGRIKEQGGAGLKHSLMGGKTIRTLYSGVSEGEMVRLFGDESPDAGNVQKIVTLDANGTASVTYQNKDGKVLATALNAGTTPSNLEVLSTRTGSLQRIYEEIKDEVPYGPYGSSSKKPLLFTSDVTVNVEYTITPQVIAAICGSACSTCDYKVEFILHNPDPAGGDQAETLLQTVNIPGTLSCTASPTSISPVSFLAKANTNYVLEKRVSTNTPVNPTLTHLQDYLNRCNTSMGLALSTTNNQLTIVRNYLTNNDLAGLNTYMQNNLTYSSATNTYSLTIHFGGGCLETIAIPKEDVCESPINITSTNPCRSNSQDFEAYFNSVWSGTYTATGTTGALYVTNKYKKSLGQAASLYQARFTSGQFNTMVQNLLTQNPLVTCQMVWEVWVEQVALYGDYAEYAAQQTVEPIEGMSGEALTFENNLFDRFLSVLDERLALSNTGDRPTDACFAGPTYFIKKTAQYGVITSGEVVPVITEAFKYVYYNNGNAQMSGAQSAFFASLSKSTFASLTDCEKYKYWQIMDYGQFAVPTAPEKEKRRLFAISKCKEQCEMRREEFRQAIINNILTQTPSATFEHYFVSVSPVSSTQYVAAYDTAVNHGVAVTYTECQIEALTEALVRNCQNTYCNLTFTGTNNNTLGLTAEIDKIKKVLQNNFEVQVNAVGAGCSAGWDNIPGPIGPHSNSTTYWGFKHPDTGNSFTTRIASNASGDQFLWRNVSSGALSITSKLDKVSSSGTVLWSKNIITHSNSQPNFCLLFHGDAEVDGAGNVVIAGQIGITSGTVDFDPATSAGGVSASSLGVGGIAYFIAKYDGSGNFQWVKILKFTVPVGSASDYLFFNPLLEIDGSNNIFFAAALPGTMDFDPSSATFNLTATGTQMGYSYGINPVIASYTSSGNFIQAKAFYATNHQQFSDFERDNSGNFYVYAYVHYQYSDPGTMEFDLSSTTNSVDVTRRFYIGKYSSSLALLSVNTIARTTTGSGEEGQLTTDPSGNIYITGFATSQYDFDFGAGTYQLAGGAFLAKYTSAGILVWAIQLGGSPSRLDDLEYESNFNTITLLASAESYSKLLVAKYGTNGNYLGEFKLPGAGPMDINLDGAAVYLAASGASGTLDIDITAGVNNITAGGAFFAKYYIQTPTGCLTPKSMCFRFTTARVLTDPAAWPDEYTYDPQALSCAVVKTKLVSDNLEDQISAILDKRRDMYKTQYLSACADPSKLNDKFIVNYEEGLHHFTLYYYDRAGNLMRTVPPEGVYAEPPAHGWGSPANPTSLLKDVSTEANLIAARTQTTNYRLITEYQYNSLGQLIRQHTPDGNGNPAVDTRPLVNDTESVKNASKYYANFIYDDQGRLRFAQNAKQKAAATFSYTKYDELSRVIEAGEATGYVEATVLANRNVATYPTSGTREVTYTVYNTAYTGTPALPAGYVQKPYLRNRVSYVYTDEDGSAGTTLDRLYSVYSYDPHGNVEWLVQSLPELYTAGQHAMIGIRYEYDLLNGNIKQVSYNPGMEDQFFHRYEYDADKRIKSVSTSRDGKIWDKDVRYAYFVHGPLKRAVLGEDKVQGIDYTYTINGWLKAINAPWAGTSLDPGGDGLNLVATRDTTAQDAFGMQLGYYSGDYYHQPTAGTYSVFDDRNATIDNLVSYNSGTSDLYNGNISSSLIYQLPKSTNAWNTDGAALRYEAYSVGDQYRYDELNRIRYGTMLYATAGVAWVQPANQEGYSAYTYRPNGNLVTLDRNGFKTSTATMDRLQYSYTGATNRLHKVHDTYSTAATWTSDIDQGQADNNYVYDEIGNLITDVSQSTAITWTVGGKVKTTTNTSTSSSYTFIYDAGGNRAVKKNISGATTKTSFYVRDVQGNTLAIYRKQTDGSGTTVWLDEVGMYGSDHVGSYRPNQIVTGAVYANSLNTYTRVLEKKQYELKDHLSNIRALVSDQRQPTLSGSTPTSYKPELKALLNYFPFGMEQEVRTWSSTSIAKYNYGYNGKEKDDDSEFGMTNYDYGFRIYNPGIARFLSVDPLGKEYPWNTPYAFAENQPIWAIDLDGLEKITIHQRSFAPWKEFGNIFPEQKPYAGDDRGFTTSYKNVTSRITYTAKIDVAKAQQIGSTVVYSDPSIGPKNFYGQTGSSTEQPDETTKVYRQFGGGVSLSGNLQGHDARIEDYMAPDIDYTGHYSFTVKEGKLNVDFRLNGKGFPAYESFIEDEAGQKIFLYTYTAPAKDGILRLFTSSEPTIGYQFMSIDLDEKDNFKGTITARVFEKGDKWYKPGKYVNKSFTIDQWNAINEKKQAAEDK